MSSSSSKLCLLLGKWTFIIGVDSPVSIASFITTDPDNKIQSQGIAKPSSGTSKTSPGTKSILSFSDIS